MVYVHISREATYTSHERDELGVVATISQDLPEQTLEVVLAAQRKLRH